VCVPACCRRAIPVCTSSNILESCSLYLHQRAVRIGQHADHGFSDNSSETILNSKLRPSPPLVYMRRITSIDPDQWRCVQGIGYVRASNIVAGFPRISSHIHGNLICSQKNANAPHDVLYPAFTGTESRSNSLAVTGKRLGFFQNQPYLLAQCR
jgi:hypothetical protein